ncbi:MAG: hypothetical protein LBN02_04075 [Oscillospiraceae bacterium]|jgi:hypothetical protein|nr:hypothetical protein [Oscillospiraceae bacterium]
MADFDKIFAKAKEIAEIVADASVELYRTAEEKTKLVARITKLKAEIAGEKVNIRKLYSEIGKKYYASRIAELDGGEPQAVDADFEVEEVKAHYANIVLKTEEIEALKVTKYVTEDDIDIEIVITPTDDDDDDDADDTDDEV